MKRIRKVLAFTIASVMLVNTSYVQSLPVFATELQNESQPTVETDSDSAGSVSETGSPENEVTSESPDKGNQPEGEPGTSDSEDVRETSEDSSEDSVEESSQGTEQAVSADSEESSEKEYGESSDGDKAGTDSVPEESGAAKTDTDSAAAASEKEEDTVIPNVRTRYEVQGTGHRGGA